MRPIDAQQKIREFAVPIPEKPADRNPARYIDCELLAAKFREYSRFGLPGASSSDGRGGEPPLPLMGATDRSILRDRNLADEFLTDAAVALERYMRIQVAWCVPRLDDTEKEKTLSEDGPKGAGLCANVWCDHVCTGFANDRLRHGRCRPCYRVFKLEGRDRDPRKEAAS